MHLTFLSLSMETIQCVEAFWECMVHFLCNVMMFVSCTYCTCTCKVVLCHTVCTVYVLLYTCHHYIILAHTAHVNVSSHISSYSLCTHLYMSMHTTAEYLISYMYMYMYMQSTRLENRVICHNIINYRRNCLCM